MYSRPQRPLGVLVSSYHKGEGMRIERDSSLASFSIIDLVGSLLFI